MGRVGRRLRKWTAAVLDLPQDVALGLPRFTLVGGARLTVENHRGVLEFTADTLRLALDDGTAEVTGESLVIRNIGAEELVVEGVIAGVRLVPGGHK